MHRHYAGCPTSGWQHEIRTVEDVDSAAERFDRWKIRVAPGQPQQPRRGTPRPHLHAGALRHRGELLLAPPGESGEDDVKLGILGQRGADVPDVVPNAGTDAEQRGGV